MKEWEAKNKAYLAEIARDDDLGDTAFIEVLEDLVERAQSMIDAKREEIDQDDQD